MRPKAVAVWVFGCVALVGTALAQSASQTPSNANQKGFAAYSEFSGSVNSTLHEMDLDSRLGYNFTNHFGLDFGVPFYFTGGTTSSTGTTTQTTTQTSYSATGIGNAYLQMRLMYPNPALSYNSALKLMAPTGDSKKGLSTGRATFDWTHRLERSFSSVTPFIEAGAGNTIIDTPYFTRPFSSLGFNAHLRPGIGVGFAKIFTVGGSYYAILPVGTQKMYSRVTGQAGTNGKNPFDSATISGSSDLTSDHGVAAFFDISPNSVLDIEAGYTHSSAYALNTISFGIGLDIGQMMKKSNRK